MKFRCERDVLVEAFSSAARAVANRTPLPVLTGVRLELSKDILRLTGSDLDLTIQVITQVSGEEDGICVVPAKLGADVFRSLPSGAVSFNVDQDQVKISSGRSSFALRTLNADDFPKISEPPENGVTLVAQELASAIRQVIGSASKDDSRPILTGVLMTPEDGGLRLVATDSYRLSVRDLPGSSVLTEGQAVLVPHKALGELARLLGSSKDDVNLLLGEREATFVVGQTHITTRLIDGQYPPYRNLIPAHLPNKLTINRAALLEALRRVSLLAKDSTPVRLTLGGDTLELAAVAQDVGQASESVEASYAGENMVVAFNPDYLIAGVEYAEAQTITIETIDHLKPAVIRAVDRPDFLYLLMPVRV